MGHNIVLYFLQTINSTQNICISPGLLEEQNQLKEYILHKKTDQSGFLDGRSGPTTLGFRHAEAGKAAAAQFTGLDALVGPIWC